MLLLDTCALLILAGTKDELPEQVSLAIRLNPESIFVSSITAFEIALKCRLGKLSLPLATGKWYNSAVELHNINEIPVSSEIALMSAELPFIHKDPCDRIIVATALSQSLKIITPDETIAKYPGVKVIW